MALRIPVFRRTQPAKDAPDTREFVKLGSDVEAVVAALVQYVADKFAASSLGSLAIRTHALLTSLSADDHKQYALLAGRSGTNDFSGTLQAGHAVYNQPALGTAGGQLRLWSDLAYGAFFGISNTTGELWIQSQDTRSATAYPIVLNKNGGTAGTGGTPAASGAWDIQSTTGALIVPRMTTAQKNALTAVAGMIVYDTSLASFYKYTGGAWVAF